MRGALVVIGAALLATPAAADQGTSGNPVAQSIRQSWETAKRNVRESADAMPEATYGFQPTKEVRTFGQILAHIAGANYIFCSAAKGEKSPHAEDAFEKTATTRAAIIKALDASLAYCDSAYAGVTDAQLSAPIALPFDQGKGVRARALIWNVDHLNEHYGNLVTYLRINNIVPPSSRR
jgi:uncharacterized damage-inducible protein DinB